MSGFYRLTPIHHWHEQWGARFLLEAGWQRVHSYGDVDEEVSLVCGAAGLTDVTPLTKVDLQGIDAAAFLARHLEQGAVPEPGWHSHANIDAVGEGGSVHVIRLTANRFWVFDAPAARESLMARLSRVGSEFRCVHVTDLTSGLAAIRLAGPASAAVLKKICALNLDPGGLLSGQCAQAPVAQVGATVIRDDFVKLMSYLIVVSRDYGEYVWKSLISAGERQGITHFGLAAERLLARGDTHGAAVQ